MRFSDPGYDTREPVFPDEYEQQREPDPEPPHIYPPCDLCGEEGIAADNDTGHVFCSDACHRCYSCEHRSGVACWYRMNMGQRAGHAWIKRVKRCPKEKQK